MQPNLKNGLLVCSGTGKNKNIGDYIQSLASEQFFENIDCLVEREDLKNFESEIPVKVIMNGWFMWNPENWPPSKDIIPLFTSFHLVPTVADRMLTNEGVEYLKKFEPIGCRDLNTQKLLEEKGIKAYFSGCLTLCLGMKYKSQQQKNKIIFVDPYYETIRGADGKINVSIFIRNLCYGMTHIKKIKKLWNRIEYEHTGRFEFIFNRLNRFLNCSSFYRTYSSKFTDDVLFNAKFFTHAVSQSVFNSEEDKLEYARNLLREYGSAKYVVTSRIHCALPCLGIETPVLFITSENLESDKRPIRSPGRFGGLINLFRVITFSNGKLYGDDSLVERKFDNDFSFENKTDYIELKKRLEAICKQFVS